MAVPTRRPASSLSRWLWGLAATVALLWPAHISGRFDGMPLDGTAEAIVVGVVFPALLWLYPRGLTTRFARACVIALLGWKALTAVAFVQDGWCVRFTPSGPYVKDATGAPHSWDVRADWRSPDPSCSAIMTRSYDELSQFPVWFFNLPPASDSWPGPTDRPPGATTSMTVSGFVHAPQSGVMQIETGPDIAATVNIAGRRTSPEELAREGIAVDAGIQKVLIEATLTGDRWKFVPRWNGADLLSSPMATVQRPSAFETATRPWIGWVTSGLVLALVVSWLGAFLFRVRGGDGLAWIAGASGTIGLLASSGDGSLAQWAIAALVGAAFVRLPPRLKNATGGLALIGIPWLTFIVVMSAPQIGHFTLYPSGHDFWGFQRYGYRIVMQGYWLEGGSPTFWFQPFYRWISGILHLIFGDPSVGEWYWDGACVLTMAMFSFAVTKAFAGFRWGIVAAVMTLTVFTLGTSWQYLGRGLSEISSAGLISLAALVAMRSRHRRWSLAIAAGVLATLAFYTRLNNLPMALGVAIFALPICQPVRTLFQPRTWIVRISWPTAIAVVVVVGVGLLLFAWRTWYYTGVFSVFYGTQRDLLSLWQPGMAIGTLLERMAGSVMMVLTMNDPARFDPYSLPLLIGAGVSVLGIAGVPKLRELPLDLLVFCLVALSGALVTRGSAYSGRFSIHMIAVTCAVVTCTAAFLWRSVRLQADVAVRLKPDATPE